MCGPTTWSHSHCSTRPSGTPWPTSVPSLMPTATGWRGRFITTGTAAGTDLVGPQEDAAGDGGKHRCFAKHLGLEHMAYQGVQGRGVLVDLAHHLGHEWRGVDLQTLQEIMAADNVVVEPGDMLVLHTGFATKILEWDPNPDPRRILTTCTYLDARDESLLEWITDSQIAALIADNYAVEGLVGRDRDESRHSLLPIHHLCLFRLGVPLGELWYLHELATWLRATSAAGSSLPPLRCGCPAWWVPR